MKQLRWFVSSGIRKLCWHLFSRYPVTDFNGKRVWIAHAGIGITLAKTGNKLTGVRRHEGSMTNDQIDAFMKEQEETVRIANRLCACLLT